MGACKVMYILGPAKLWLYPDKLNEYDELLKATLSSITNVGMTDLVWSQASLPVRSGGLGVRQTAALALPAYLASVCAVKSLAPLISPAFDWVETVAATTGMWRAAAGGQDVPPPEKQHAQTSWDSPLAVQIFENMLHSSTDVEKARLLAVATEESGRWLLALPVDTIGTLLDDDTLRISVAVRLSADVCYRHRCRCGEGVDEMGRHGLRCKLSQGRFPRHTALNDIICRALAAAGSSAVLEPPGLARDDGRRPDGVTQFAWKNGRQMIWDATCVDTLAHVSRTIVSAGAPADDAEQIKRSKYEDLASRYIFVPVGFETFGSLGSAANEFLAELGRKLGAHSGEPRSSEYLLQRVSLAIQRGNAVSVLGTREASRGLDDVFYLLKVQKGV